MDGTDGEEPIGAIGANEGGGWGDLGCSNIHGMVIASYCFKAENGY